MGSGQTFFKVVWSSEKLKIPPAFVFQVQGALPNRVFLRDRYKNSWPVEIARNGDEWYFHKGWTKFYRDKSLEPNDILVFEYKGKNLFDFKLFGKNACEKGEKSSLMVRVKEEVEEYNGHDDDEENDEDFVDSEENDDDDDDDDDDYVQEEDEEKDEDFADSEENDDDDEDEDEDDDDYVKEEEHQVNTSKNRGSTYGVETIPSKRRYKKKNVHEDCYGADIFRSGLAPRPKNPFFVTRSRTKARKNELHIPKDVIVDYHLNIPEKLFLVDEQGRKWETKIKQWKDGRLWCTRGWRSLCNVNNIEMNDTCICEFVQEQEQGCKDNMYIRIRVVDGVGRY